MAQIEVLTAPPVEGDFVPLAEFQSATPGSFFGGKPVLHYSCKGGELYMLNEYLNAHPTLPALMASDANGTTTASDDPNKLRATVDIFVTDEKVSIFNHATSCGVGIPYPMISLHATRRIVASLEAVYMQIELSNTAMVYSPEDYVGIELDLYPLVSTTIDATNDLLNGNNSTPLPTQQLYTAIAACTDLHPDPNDSESENGDAMPATTGTQWITSENMAQFTDEDGNFRGFGENGSGPTFAVAGTRRAREEEEDAEDAIDTGEVADGDGGKEREDAKWRRTE